MKTIGLIGGMSWESTVTYYKIINETIKEQLGGFHSAKIVLYSVDFAEIEQCQACGDWTKSAEILSMAAYQLQRAGADFIIICTNTMHKVISQIERRVQIPILHIADATADQLESKNIKKVALLGTKYTMMQEFYRNRLEERGFQILVPESEDIEIVNHIIYEELCKGVILQESKQQYLRIINKLKCCGAEGVVLGCTEIGLLINQSDIELPVFDTTQIHGRMAALKALKISNNG